MYYQNGNYLQDFNYYNQIPNFGYNPMIGTNYQNLNNNPMQTQNISAMYPAVYRIIAPVVMQVLSKNNINYLTEDSLNNMVDMVYEIVEGDINLTKNSSMQNDNIQSNNCEKNASSVRQTSANNTTSNQNSLLKDLIKIMILNEIITKRQNNQMMMQNNNINSQMYM